MTLTGVIWVDCMVNVGIAGIYPHNPGCNHGKCEGFLAIVIPDPKNVICHPGSDEDSASLGGGFPIQAICFRVVDLALSQAAKP